MQPAKLRTIIEEHRFAIELQALIEEGPEKAQRADEFVDGVKWLLARSPEKGTRIGQTNVWFIPSEHTADLLPVVIYYTFDDDYVNLMSIQATLYPIQK
ncbi:MAG: hypothetical protein L0Z53_07740 [Acidobacteriales bacterium]|nr:hypothetical protein [Terriglobales bacterium]